MVLHRRGDPVLPPQSRLRGVRRTSAGEVLRHRRYLEERCSKHHPARIQREHQIHGDREVHRRRLRQASGDRRQDEDGCRRLQEGARRPGVRRHRRAQGPHGRVAEETRLFHQGPVHSLLLRSHAQEPEARGEGFQQGSRVRHRPQRHRHTDRKDVRDGLRRLAGFRLPGCR